MMGFLKSGKTAAGRLREEGGFTLTELLVALVIASLVFVGAYRMYINSVRVNSVQSQIVNTQQNARVVMGQLTRELRLAGYNPAQPEGGAAILALGEQTLSLNALSGKEFEIQGDFNGDGVVEQIAYEVENDDDGRPWLTRLVSPEIEAVQFGANIEDLEFRFYDANNDVLDTATCGPAFSCGTLVRRVTIRLTARTERPDMDFIDPAFAADPDPMKKHYRRRVLESDVILRNTGKGSDTVPPLCPTNVAGATNGDCRTISVTWSPAPNEAGDLAGYYVYYEEAPDSVNVFTSPYSRVSHDKDATSYEFLLSVPNEGNWNIAVASFDTSGNLCDSVAGGDPDPVTATGSPVNVGPGNLTPEAPGNVRGKPGSNQVSLSWADAGFNTDESPANDLAGFRVYRSLVDTPPGPSDLIADESALPINQSFGGGTTQVTNYVDSDVNTPVTAENPSGGPDNCTLYYYWVSAVDNCGLESAKTEMESIKPDGNLSTGITPPNNGTGPPAPVISSLLAGDDTSSIIIRYVVPAPTGVQSTPVGVKIHWRVYDAVTPPPWNNGDPPVDVPITDELPTSGEWIVSNLEPDTTYEVMVSSYDDGQASCGINTDSPFEYINTNECAPRWSAPFSPSIESNHKLVPGNSYAASSLPHDGSAQIGVLSPLGERYVSWVGSPYDCSPDSANFGVNGFDFQNPPAYDEVAADTGALTSAHVLFEILKNNPVDGTFTTYPANDLYGKDATGLNPGNPVMPANSLNRDAAPRGEGGYYHFPADPMEALHIDTAQFCDGRYVFRATAFDGELLPTPSAILVDISNGRLEVDLNGQVTSRMEGNQDIHTQVVFPIQNTSTSLSLRMNKIGLDWWNSNAFLSEVKVYAEDLSELGSWNQTTGTPSGLASRGSEVILDPVPVFTPAGTANTSRGWIVLTFRHSLNFIHFSTEMRPWFLSDPSQATVTITTINQQSEDAFNLDPATGICPLTDVGTIVIPEDPKVDLFSFKMDQPVPGTFPTTTPTDQVLLDSNPGVTVSARVAPADNRSLTYTKVFYYVDADSMVAAPPRPSGVNGGGLYTNQATGVYDSANDLWNITIPPNHDSQVWYYMEALDGNAGDQYDRNYDIVPDSGVFGYTDCGTTLPTVNLTKPNGATAQGMQDVNIDVTSPVPLKKVQFFVRDAVGDSVAPDTAGQIIQLCPGSNGLCVPDPGGSDTKWTTTYDSDDGAITSVPHDLEITATNVCGNTSVTLIKEFNK